MRRFLVGILSLAGWLATTELASAQCCRMPMTRFVQPRFPSLIPVAPSFPITSMYATPVIPTSLYPYVPNPSTSPSLPLRTALPKPSANSPPARTAITRETITRETQTLVRSPDELEVKAKELFQKGITAEQEGNLFLAETCYYQGFTSYPESSVASRARAAYARVEGELRRRPKSR